MVEQLAEKSERELLIAARRDLQQFAPVYQRYFRPIYGYCLRRVNSAQEAEDLTSTIFTRAMTSLDQYRGGLVSAWLFRIAHNTVVNYLRSNRPQISLDNVSEIHLTDGLEPLEGLIHTEEANVIHDLVSQLPSAQQDLLLLKIVGECSTEEIAAVTGKSPGAVRVSIHRILKQLYVQYQKYQAKQEAKQRGGASNA